MKIAWRSGLAAALGLMVSGAGGEDPYPEAGWSRDQVIEAMGRPQGLIRGDPIEMLYFERGVVQLRDGVVVSADLVSTENAARLKAERLAREAQDREERAEHRKRLLQEGLAERERFINDPSLNLLPSDRQLEFWESFARRYPDVNVSSQILAARARWETQQEKQELLRRISQLEQRVADAERRALQAESSARIRPQRIYVPYFMPYPLHPPARTNEFPRRPPPFSPPTTNRPGSSIEMQIGF